MELEAPFFICDGCDDVVPAAHLVMMVPRPNVVPKDKYRQWTFAFCPKCNNAAVRNKVLTEAARRVEEWAKTLQK